MNESITRLFTTPKTIAVIAETNQGKSNLLYYIITLLSDGKHDYDLHTYGLRNDIGEQKIHSLAELEIITNSVIIIDEFESLFDVENRKNRQSIENSLRLIHHNNNILIICGLPDNFKKFLSNKVDIFIFKRCRAGSFINGSAAKTACIQYRGTELGSTMLNLAKNEALIYDGNYTKIDIPYIEKYDTKKGNVQIVRLKTSAKMCSKTSSKKAEKIVH